MAGKYYQWQRYWRPRGSPLLFFENGFLFSPGRYNSQVLPFEKIADDPCLVLLGEPGMGKSHAMKTERDFIIGKAEGQNESVLWQDLRSYGSADELRAKVFGHPVFQAWVAGDHKLHLFLDSFDECHIAIKQLASLLTDELQEYRNHNRRLNLRIACRTADWPRLLENGLTEIWGAKSVRVYELAPLTRGNARVAAVAEEVDPDHFLSEVDHREVGPLAAKPVTLRLLLNLYRQGGALPASQVELYARGCSKLAEETSDSYVEAGRAGSLEPPQRMAVAARVAAVSIFSQKSAIWTASDFGEPAEDDLRIADLCGGVEFAGSASFEVDAAAIKEAMNTGLFDSRGENRMGWGHQTYAEFLAAWYLTQMQMPAEQVLKLLVHPEDPDGRLVPQLHETAAWLAGMMPGLFEEIMRRDPKVLLQSDVASADVASRAALVGELLKLYDEERDFGNDWFRASRYHKLDHPAIADQIRSFTVNCEKGFLSRRAAIEMAEACKVSSLQNDLANLALDSAQSLELRICAARAVASIGDAEVKLRLKPLVTGEAGDDTEQLLQHMGLRALWPAQLSAEEVFSLLSSSSLSDHFISQDLIEGLKPSDLPVALGWVERQPGRNRMNFYECKLVNRILSLAWSHLEVPGALKAFARAALSRVRKGDPIVDDRDAGLDAAFSDSPQPEPKFSEQWEADSRKRRLVLETIASFSNKADLTDGYWFSSRMQETFGEDVSWMIERLLSEASEERQLVWARLIRLAYNWDDHEQKIAILTACQTSRALLQTFHRELMALHHSLTEAGEKTAGEVSEREAEEPSLASLPPVPLPAERIADLLDKSEAGDSEAWCELNWTMRFSEDGNPDVDEFEPNVKLYPGWERADPSTRRRILAAARHYLLERDAQPSEWLGTNTLWPPAYYGYHALRLLYEEDQAFFLTLDSQVWKKWAPIVVAYQMFIYVKDKAEERAIQKTLVGAAYRHAPNEVIGAVFAEIDRDYAYVPTTIKCCWDERFGRALLDKARELYAKRRSIADLIDELLAHDTDGARDFAESLLSIPLPTDPREKQQRVVVAHLLMKHSKDAAWPVVWPLIQNDEEFGRRLIEEQADIFRGPKDKNPPLPHRLTEEQLADLYIWMLRQYPPSEDIYIKGPHSPSARELVEQWRDSILTHLKDRGSAAACRAVERVACEFPELKWVKAQLLVAQALLRQHSWRPPAPTEILRMAYEQQKQMALRGEQRRWEEIFRALWVLECTAEGSEEFGETCGQGTAFILADVGLVTCHHVLCPHIKAFRADAPARKFSVEVAAESADLDLAVLRIIDAPAVAELEARYSPELVQGESIAIAGFPNYSFGSSGVFFEGAVGGFRQYHGIRSPLIDAQIIQGNSGGPVLDSEWRVVGVAVRGAQSQGEANSAEHAIIPISALRHLNLAPIE